MTTTKEKAKRMVDLILEANNQKSQLEAISYKYVLQTTFSKYCCFSDSQANIFQRKGKITTSFIFRESIQEPKLLTYSHQTKNK